MFTLLSCINEAKFLKVATTGAFTLWNNIILKITRTFKITNFLLIYVHNIPNILTTVMSNNKYTLVKCSKKNIDKQYFQGIYLIDPSSYETKNFCFISVQKGMIINYMLPVSILIVLTTICSLNGMRKINSELSKLGLSTSAESLLALKSDLQGTEMEKKQADAVYNKEILKYKECKTCLKITCMVQMAYDIIWFIAVVALENVKNSIAMPVLFAVTTCILVSRQI